MLTAEKVAAAEAMRPGGLDRGLETVGRDGGTVIAKLDQSLDASLAPPDPPPRAVISAFRAVSPDAIDVEFGPRLDAESGAVFAKSGIGAHFTVTLSRHCSREHTVGADSAPDKSPAS